MWRFLVYGIRATDPEGARREVERAFGIDLELRNGMCEGGDYWRTPVAAERANAGEVFDNHKAFDEEWRAGLP